MNSDDKPKSPPDGAGLGGMPEAGPLPDFAREAARRFQLLLESSEIGFWERDLTSDRLYWCPRQERLMGFAPGTFPGNFAAFEQLVVPEDLRVLRDAQRDAIRNGGHYSAELRFRTVDGRLRWGHVRGVFIYDEQGTAVRIVGVDIDITDRKHAAAEVKAGQQFLEKIVESVPGAVFRFRLAGRIPSLEYMSPGASEIFGIPAEDMIRNIRLILPRLHPDEIDRIRESILQSATEQSPWHQEFRFRHPIRDWVWIEGRSMPEADPDGSVVWTGFVADVTPRKQLDAALEQQRRKLQLILDSVPALIFVKGRDHRFRRVNREVCRILGLAPHQIEGKTAEELGSEFASRYHRDDDHVMSSGLPLRGIVEPIDTNTGTRWLQTDKIPFVDELGQVMGVIGLAVDITDRLRAEGALRLSEARLREAQAIAQIGSFFWNAAEDKATWSEELFRIFEVDPREFHPSFSGYLSFVHPDDRRRISEELHRVLMDGELFQHDYRLLTRTGTMKWMRATGRVVRSDNGDLQGITGTCQDVTSQRMAEEAIKSSEELYRQLLDVIPSAVMILTNDLVRYCNRSLLRLVGAVDPSEILGRSPLEFVAQEHHSWVLERVSQLLLMGQSTTIPELTIVQLGGELVPAEVVITPIIFERRMSVLVALHDLSVRRKTEEQLRHAQRMEVVGRLAGGIAHDFNNLLTVILSCTEVVLDSMPVEDPRHRLIDSIRTAGERAAGLTRQLLAFSRRQVVKLVELNLNDVVRQSLLMLRRVIGEDIHIQMHLSEDLPMVEVDPVQMEQVMMNIVVNARDAMPFGGLLTIKTDTVFIHGGRHAGHLPDVSTGRFVCMTIEDTGVGMSEDVREKVFDPFFTTKEPGKGTGLGLSVVHGIIKQCNGTIDVESRPSEGTSFRIMLPAVSAKSKTDTAISSPGGKSGGSETVLIVEDEAAVRAIASYSLQKIGYRVLTASDADEALRIAESVGGQVNLLATDVVLPDRSGRDLAVELLSRFPGLRVLFLSGYTDDEVLKYGIEQSAVAFLQKPYTPEMLAQKIRGVLDAKGPDE